jgi:hypothetical protein
VKIVIQSSALSDLAGGFDFHDHQVKADTVLVRAVLDLRSDPQQIRRCLA